MKTLKNSDQTSLFGMELDESTSSPEGFLVKTCQYPENKPGSKAEPDQVFGLKSHASLTSYDQSTSLWRTSQTCFLDLASDQGGGFAEFSETWPRSGMMRSGTAYQLPTLGPGTSGTESGWLPTPTKSDSKGSPKGRYFGSPTYRRNLKEVLRDGPDDPVFPNPEFVEEMMGYPKSFTVLNDWETVSSRKSRK